MSNKKRAWAKLIFEPDKDFKEPVEICEDRIVIGRAPVCALCIRDNKHISAQHCAIEKSDEGRFYVVDLSANGIFLNGTEKIGKGKRREITDGSVVFLVKKKGNAAADLSFKFILMPPKQLVESDLTATYSADDFMDLTQDEPSPVKGPGDKSDQLGEPASKKFRSSENEDAAKNAPSTSAKNNEDSGPPAAAAADPSTCPKGGDGIAENLVCSICFDIIHDCVSLQPCMHCFCAGCYSEWMSRSNACPECRVEVCRINKNHVINNVINAFLKEHPDKKRPDDDLKSLDAKNTITQDMLNLKSKKNKQKAGNDDDDHGSDCDCSECDDYSSSDDDPVHQVVQAMGAGYNNYNLHRPAYYPQCRLCVGFRGFPVLNARARPVPPRPCPAGQPHIMCQCCFSNMPDRRQENNPALPPISCTTCQRTFCDLYFGCSRAGCVGCLARFKDIRFDDVTYNDILNSNQYETTILKNYMASKNKTWIDVVKECVAKLDGNEYQCPDKAAYHLNSESPLCQTCGLRNFRELVYQYRQNIPKNDLPGQVTSRPDCYWGKNCRTQRSKFQHAANFNHICEQTKF